MRKLNLYQGSPSVLMKNNNFRYNKDSQRKVPTIVNIRDDFNTQENDIKLSMSMKKLNKDYFIPKISKEKFMQNQFNKTTID